MKLFRIALVGAGAWWFLDRREGPSRRRRVLEAGRGLVERARAMLEGSGLELAPGRGGPGRDDAGARAGAGTERGRGGSGARRATRPPEVHEVKSPAELEPGVYSASPDPARPGRVDRPGLRGEARAHGPLPDELEPTAEDWRHGDVTPRVDLAGPPEGSHLTEAHLGVYVPREEGLEAPDRGLRASDDDAAEETAGRRDPGRE